MLLFNLFLSQRRRKDVSVWGLDVLLGEKKRGGTKTHFYLIVLTFLKTFRNFFARGQEPTVVFHASSNKQMLNSSSPNIVRLGKVQNLSPKKNHVSLV